MDGNVLGVQIVPDQMQVVNPAMVLILIPIFDKVLNPFMIKHEILENPLHRMAIGGIIAGLAFLSAGILELVLERTYPEIPDANQAFFNFINTLPCDVYVYNPFNRLQRIPSGSLHKFKDLVQNSTQYKLKIEASAKCGVQLVERKNEIVLQAIGGQVRAFTVILNQKHLVMFQVDTIVLGISNDNKIKVHVTDPIDFKKSLNGKPRLRYNSTKLMNWFHVSFQNCLHKKLECTQKRYNYHAKLIIARCIFCS